jgi:hypothetical protein
MERAWSGEGGAGAITDGQLAEQPARMAIDAAMRKRLAIHLYGWIATPIG